MVKTWARHNTTETVLHNGWRPVVVGSSWRLADSGWWELAVGSWQLVAVGSGWRLGDSGWWQLAVGGCWQLVIGSWRLVLGAWWYLGAVRIPREGDKPLLVSLFAQWRPWTHLWLVGTPVPTLGSRVFVLGICGLCLGPHISMSPGG